MTVTWSTAPGSGRSYVRYALADALEPITFSVAEGFATEFRMPGSKTHKQYIHRASMTGLSPGLRYQYHIWNGSAGFRDSTKYHFTAMKDGFWTPRIAVMADFGLENPVSLSSLQSDVEQGSIDCVVHVGDIAYDDYENNGKTGDLFLQMIEPIAASVPYEVSQGNHEAFEDAVHYRNRWTMQNWETNQNLYHSFNVGPLHWIAFNTEFYFSNPFPAGSYGPYPEFAKRQLIWLEQDLIQANRDRAQRPWVVAFGHRPFYCSGVRHGNCAQETAEVRSQLETLFYKYGVDLVFGGHVHAYERLLPTYNNKVLTAGKDPYLDPLGPVHIIAASAGCLEDVDTFPDGNFSAWSAVRIPDYGYGYLTAVDAKTLNFTQVKGSTKEAVDTVIIKKRTHFPAWLPQSRMRPVPANQAVLVSATPTLRSFFTEHHKFWYIFVSFSVLTFVCIILLCGGTSKIWERRSK